jgi:hypothetical protein
MPKAFRFTLVLLALLGMYLGWVYYTRWENSRTFVEKMEEQRGSGDGKLSDVYGGGRLTIISFYTTAPYIRSGETAQLCYGVASAEDVRIEPPVENVWPSVSRCVDVSPEKDTVYKLIAKDEDGNTATAEAAIKVIKE